MRLSLLALASVALLASACTSQPAEPSADQSANSTPAAASSPTSTAADQLKPVTETSASPSVSAIPDPDAKVIYLTFDDGPWVPYTQQILDVLAKNNATATFFVVGEMVKQNPNLIARIKDAGHAIGNHTWNHAQLSTLSDAEVRSQLNRTMQVVGKENMGACMRPPYGDTNDRVRDITKQEGYKTILWTHWAKDWEQPAIPVFLDYLQDATKDKANILLHDGGGERANTVKAVKLMLPEWIKKGFTFQALPACARPLS